MQGPKRTTVTLSRADYEWARLRGIRTDQSLSAVVAEALGALRARLEAEAQ